MLRFPLAANEQAGSSSSRDEQAGISSSRNAPKRGLYHEPKITVIGGYSDDKLPTKQSGEYHEPLASIIAWPTPSIVGYPLFSVSTSTSVQAPSCESPMSRAGRATLLGNF